MGVICIDKIFLDPYEWSDESEETLLRIISEKYNLRRSKNKSDIENFMVLAESFRELIFLYQKLRNKSISFIKFFEEKENQYNNEKRKIDIKYFDFLNKYQNIYKEIDPILFKELIN